MSWPGLIARAAATRPHGREGIWRVLRAADRPLSVREVWERANSGARGLETERDTVDQYLRALWRAGILGRSRRGRCYRYSLLRDTGPEPPRVRTDGTLIGDPARPDGWTRMWRAIHALKEFDVLELAVTASVSRSTAKHYASILGRAGLLVVAARPDRRRGRLQRWAFVPAMSPGPRAPRIIRHRGRRMLFDPNAGRVIWPRERAS